MRNAHIVGKKTAPLGLEGNERSVEKGNAHEELPFVCEKIFVAFLWPRTPVEIDETKNFNVWHTSQCWRNSKARTKETNFSWGS
jgi:hypothetical protein